MKRRAEHHSEQELQLGIHTPKQKEQVKKSKRDAETITTAALLQSLIKSSLRNKNFDKVQFLKLLNLALAHQSAVAVLSMRLVQADKTAVLRYNTRRREQFPEANPPEGSPSIKLFSSVDEKRACIDSLSEELESQREYVQSCVDRARVCLQQLPELQTAAFSFRMTQYFNETPQMAERGFYNYLLDDSNIVEVFILSHVWERSGSSETDAPRQEQHFLESLDAVDVKGTRGALSVQTCFPVVSERADSPEDSIFHGAVQHDPGERVVCGTTLESDDTEEVSSAHVVPVKARKSVSTHMRRRRQ